MSELRDCHLYPVNLTEQELTALRRLAERERRTASDQAAVLIVEGLAARERGETPRPNPMIDTASRRAERFADLIRRFRALMVECAQDRESDGHCGMAQDLRDLVDTLDNMAIQEGLIL